MLILTPEQIQQIEREGAAAYPNECCGVMIGVDQREGNSLRRIVHRLEALANSFQADERYHRFSLNPLDLARAEKKAGEQGQMVLGFYHSHPDAPARPSEYDRQHAWPFYSYVIVSIAQGQAVDMTSWQLQEATETFACEEIQSPAPERAV